MLSMAMAVAIQQISQECFLHDYHSKLNILKGELMKILTGDKSGGNFCAKAV